MVKSILISDELHKQLKTYAVKHSKSVKEIVENAIAEVISRKTIQGYGYDKIVLGEATEFPKSELPKDVLAYKALMKPEKKPLTQKIKEKMFVSKDKDEDMRFEP